MWKAMMLSDPEREEAKGWAEGYLRLALARATKRSEKERTSPNRT